MSPLPGLCEFALTFHRELPDFICEQTITSTGTQPAVVLRAEVTFEKGREQYSNVTIDGKPAAADFSRVASAMKVISAGELGSDLVDLFKPPIVAEFQPPKEAKLRKVL